MQRMQHVTPYIRRWLPRISLIDFPGFGEIIDWLTDNLQDIVNGAVGIIKAVLVSVKNLLANILCQVTAIISYIPYGITKVINAIIAALGFLIAEAFGALPDMPFDIEAGWADLPRLDDVFSIVNWLFPMGFLVTTIGALFTLYGVWKVISVGLSWAKAD